MDLSQHYQLPFYSHLWGCTCTLRTAGALFLELGEIKCKTIEKKRTNCKLLSQGPLRRLQVLSQTNVHSPTQQRPWFCRLTVLANDSIGLVGVRKPHLFTTQHKHQRSGHPRGRDFCGSVGNLLSFWVTARLKKNHTERRWQNPSATQWHSFT